MLSNCQVVVLLPSFPAPTEPYSFRAISDQADLPLRPVMDEDSVLEMLNSSLAFSLALSPFASLGLSFPCRMWK